MDLTTFLIQCLNSLQYGLLLFLVASGLTLIFGIMGVINLAHGSFYMVGAYLAFSLAPVVGATIGGGFFATLLVGVVLAVLFGYFLEWAFFSFLYEREHLQQVLMYFVFTRTRLGMMIRAGSANREMVQSLGIDIKFLYRVVFAAGVAIAVLAGMVAAPVSSVYPGMGSTVLIICFVVVVIGGIGSIRGALFASLLIGFVDTFGKVMLPQAAGVLVYVLMALILLWKPDGLFKAG